MNETNAMNETIAMHETNSVSESNKAGTTGGVVTMSECDINDLNNVEDDYNVCCYTCGKSPCEWLEYGVDALDAILNRFDVSTAESDGYG
jgi:hypothetical protein